MEKEETPKTKFLRIEQCIVKTFEYDGKKLSAQEKMVYCYMLGWSKTKDMVFPSQDRIQEDLGLPSKRSLHNYIKDLENKGLLVVNRRFGNSNVYTVNDFDVSKAVSVKGEPVSDTVPVKAYTPKKPNTAPTPKPKPEPKVEIDMTSFPDPYYDDEIPF